MEQKRGVPVWLFAVVTLALAASNVALWVYAVKRGAQYDDRFGVQVSHDETEAEMWARRQK